jgi:hypothetical protein
MKSKKAQRGKANLDTLVGTVHPAKSMFLRQHIGTAENEKLKYEMTTILANGCPLVESKQTGKHFSLSWQDILDLAVKAGIDIPDANAGLDRQEEAK